MGALNRSLRVVQAAPASHFDRSAGCLREIHSERLTGHCFLHPRAKRGGSCPTTDPEITEKLLRCQRFDVPVAEAGSVFRVLPSKRGLASLCLGLVWVRFGFWLIYSAPTTCSLTTCSYYLYGYPVTAWKIALKSLRSVENFVCVSFQGTTQRSPQESAGGRQRRATGNVRA